MNAAGLIEMLGRQGGMLRSLFEGVSEEQARWKPAPQAWSMLEILGHLSDEERDDFRRRLRLTLEDPVLDWPPIDPEAWARERRYNERDLGPALEEHECERAASLAWLRSLRAPDWARAHVHAQLGPLAAGDLLAAWAAHDLLHLRQLVSRKLELLDAAAAPFSARYAKP